MATPDQARILKKLGEQIQLHLSAQRYIEEGSSGAAPDELRKQHAHMVAKLRRVRTGLEELFA